MLLHAEEVCTILKFRDFSRAAEGAKTFFINFDSSLKSVVYCKASLLTDPPSGDVQESSE
jgi:hypothetical protein